MDYQLVAFDLDGTLVDAYRAIWASLDYAFRSLDLPAPSAEEVKRSVGWGEVVLVQKLTKPEYVDRILTIYREHHLNSLPGRVNFLPGAREILAFLRSKNILTALATNRPSPFTQVILEDLDIVSCFDLVMCADQVSVGKPEPDLLNAVSQKLKVEPQAAVYVGDMVVDIQAAQKAGWTSVSVSTGSSLIDELKAIGPHYLFDNISQVQTLFSL